MRRWVVRAGEEGAVAAIVAKAAPGDANAVAEGRVFLGRRRVARGDEAAAVGDEVSVAPPAARAAADEAVVLARGEGWVAVDKPAGLPTIPDHGGASHALLAVVARTLGLPESKLHPTSRLDRDVSGVVVFATEAAAAERFREERAAHRYLRRYVALAANAPATEEGTWDVPIGRAKDPRHRAPNGRDPADARTHFAVAAVAVAAVAAAAAARAPSAVLLALAPVTGRTHQLRVHASHAGAPLLGDRTYGGPTRLTLASGRVLAFDRIFLHAARVTLDGQAIDAPIPETLASVWLALGGEGVAWEKAIAWSLAAQ
jgi:23S rRNA-/tRNA-specific pseudouridylate synthase